MFPNVSCASWFWQAGDQLWDGLFSCIWWSHDVVLRMQPLGPFGGALGRMPVGSPLGGRRQWASSRSRTHSRFSQIGSCWVPCAFSPHAHALDSLGLLWKITTLGNHQVLLAAWSQASCTLTLGPSEFWATPSNSWVGVHRLHWWPGSDTAYDILPMCSELLQAIPCQCLLSPTGDFRSVPTHTFPTVL